MLQIPQCTYTAWRNSGYRHIEKWSKEKFRAVTWRLLPVIQTYPRSVLTVVTWLKWNRKARKCWKKIPLPFHITNILRYTQTESTQSSLFRTSVDDCIIRRLVAKWICSGSHVFRNSLHCSSPSHPHLYLTAEAARRRDSRRMCAFACSLYSQMTVERRFERRRT
jgi:hypothetical protein